MNNYQDGCQDGWDLRTKSVGYADACYFKGDMAKAGDLILEDIKNFTEERAIPELYEKTKIMISELEVDPTLYGAAAIATDRILRKPSEYLTKK